MRAIKLPEPPSGFVTRPEIFDRGLVVRRAVIIGNGAAGAEHQSIGLARALGLASNFTLYRVDRPTIGCYNPWLRWLPVSLHRKLDSIIGFIQSKLQRVAYSLIPRHGQGVPQRLAPEAFPEPDPVKLAALAKAEMERNGPLLILASGRDTVQVAARIKMLAPDATFVVQIQHPRCPLNHFDMVVTPAHDYYPLSPAALEEVPRFLVPFLTPQETPNKNVVMTTGALHIADLITLRVAADTWHSQLGRLRKPLLVVNIGGSTRHCSYGEDLAHELVNKLKAVLDSCGTVRISFSRRTPAKICSLIQKELGSEPKVAIWDPRDPEGGPNPHLGQLAWAGAFVVTADSVSMLSEACSTGKPVYVIGAERCTWKFRSFHKTLSHKGVVRNFTGSEDISDTWSYPPLNDNALAAARIRDGLAERGWTL